MSTILEAFVFMMPSVIFCTFLLLSISLLLFCYSILLRVRSVWFSRFSSTFLSAQAQVVPDLDIEKEGNKEPAKNTMTPRPSSSSSSSSEGLEPKLKMIQNAMMPRPESPPVFSTVRTTQPTQRQPVIRRVNHNARPLTAAELVAHRSLFTS